MADLSNSPEKISAPEIKEDRAPGRITRDPGMLDGVRRQACETRIAKGGLGNFLEDLAEEFIEGIGGDGAKPPVQKPTDPIQRFDPKQEDKAIIEIKSSYQGVLDAIAREKDPEKQKALQARCNEIYGEDGKGGILKSIEDTKAESEPGQGLTPYGKSLLVDALRFAREQRGTDTYPLISNPRKQVKVTNILDKATDQKVIYDTLKGLRDSLPADPSKDTDFDKKVRKLFEDPENQKFLGELASKYKLGVPLLKPVDEIKLFDIALEVNAILNETASRPAERVVV